MLISKKKPHFLVRFDPSLYSIRLSIPCNFVKHLEGRTSGTVLLVGPSGNHWYANLIPVGNSLFFDDGWSAFVRDHFLEQGDSIAFRYDGELQFTVLIFDQSMCEKEAVFSAECSQDVSIYDNHAARKRDRERLALFDSVIEGVPKKMRCSQMHEESTNVVNEDGWMQEANNSIVTVAVPLTAVRNDRSDPPVRNRPSRQDMLLSAAEAEQIAQSFRSSYPNFLKVMKRFNISGSYTLNIPYQFATEHFPNCKVKMVLRNLKGESWTVNSIPTTKVQTAHTFCGGWLSFVRDNNIDIGDICIFELVNHCELQVRILRVGNEVTDRHDSNGGRNNDSTTMTKKKSRRKSKKVNEITGNIKGSSLFSQSSNFIAESGNPKCFGTVEKQGSQTKGCVSLKSAPEEKMAAQYFVSSYPHFVRVMKKFNISGSYTLKIPYQFSMEHMPNSRTEIVLHNLNGKCWTVNSVPTTKVQSLHTFCGGWMTFVRDNDIQMGDICIFELVGKCEMRVHICGIGKKGLHYQNGRKALPMQ